MLISRNEIQNESFKRKKREREKKIMNLYYDGCRSKRMT